MVVWPALVLFAGAWVARAFDMSQCIAPLGMESGLIPDKDITASSCYNDGNVAAQNGRLNQDIKGGAWCPRTQVTTEASEWLEVDLHGVHVITAVGTQGRFGNGLGQEYAEAYVLEYWRPRLAKWLRYRTPDGHEILTGNTNTYLVKKNQLQPLWASKVRFIPYSAHRRTVCMRVELYGCPWMVGIVSYSMPKGDKRSNGVELSDTTYDGQWVNGELRGGLGQLVDGQFGGDDIREAARASAWVGWRNDSAHTPPALLFEFDRVREFSAVHIYCNNKFMRDVQVFSEAVIWFSIGGRHFQEEPVRYQHAADNIFESARNVSIKLHHRIARYVRIELHFAARWILVSEVVFDSDVAQGNYTSETGKIAGKSKKQGTIKASSSAPPISTARRDDPLYVAVIVGVFAALVILLAAAVFLVLHRHRHRKCFASHKRTMETYSACGCGSEAAADKPADKCAEYQEPYTALKCGPYLAYNTVLMEMDTLAKNSDNYEYAVPEMSSAPLLESRPAPDAATLASRHNTSLSHNQVLSAMRRRLETCSVYEFPRHRLRMISKLAEGSFGTVYVAEADGVPEYEGGVCADKRLVAVKFLAPDAETDDREQFERDVRVLASLSHARLCRVVGACRSPPLALVLEYLPGGDLCAFLRNARRPPPLAALLHLAEQLADGMRYLEALNFVHRDLAARNCLVGPDYELKIGDLGTDSEAYAGDYYRGARVAGSVAVRWAAWEAALAADHSTAADVWAFAVTLHEIFTLCRRPPLHHLTDEQVVDNLELIRSGGGGERPARGGACPRDVYELMTACWRRDPAHRPTFADAHLFLQGKSVSYRPS